VSIFITRTDDRARREADASAARHAAGAPRGPLDGVRVSWKDLLDVAGAPTTCGSIL
jgi:aspartyl-tRNA(Asn)/glutamyl-tRNA(Gln) amidotransferase subunit A